MSQQATRVFEMLDRAIELFPDKEDYLAYKQDGQWVKYSPQQYKDIADYVSIGLLQMGLKPGDKVATITGNRPEWNFIDMGAAQAGIIHVPVYTTITEEEFRHILSHSDSVLVFVEDRVLYNKIKPIADEIERIKNVYTFDKVEGAPHWSEIMQLGMDNATEENYKKIEEIKSSIDKDDVVSILYTSGTTGLAKGVMLTHWNFMYQVHRVVDLVPIGPEDVGLSFLPICHSLERVVNYVYQYVGISTYYAEGLHKLGDNMKEVKPTIFATVPRVLERIYDKIVAKGNQLEGTKRKLFFWALDLAKKFDFNNGLLYKTRLALADTIIFTQWRKAVGGRVRFIISGGAKLEPQLNRIFWGAGFKVLEGYGLTETSPVISVNNPKYGIKIGSVGPKIGPEQQIKIADDGEILFKGPNLMKGYYKDEEKTREVIDDQGWFHTGDVGYLDEDGFLYITDRKKEIFKLKNGKYIAPQPIENHLQSSMYIEQAFVLGMNQKMPGAIIVPNFEALRKWAQDNNLQYRDNQDLISKPEVIKLIKDEVGKINKTLASYEKIGPIRLVVDQWSPGTGELSPTLKKRRRVLNEKYKDLIEEMFKE